MPPFHPVILSGGVGSRLWPLSRRAYPKQFLPLAGDHTMLQSSVARLQGTDAAAPLIVANDEHRFIVAEQMRELGVSPAGIVLEPFGRNTAPAIAFAALTITQRDPDAVMLVLPADHVIEDVSSFHAALNTATGQAADGALVTFGIVPSRPETGYGYIQGASDGECSKVERFIEKPPYEKAQEYVEAGGYYWNSGMFMARADTLLEELERFAPEVIDVCRRAHDEATQDIDFTRIPADVFAECPDISIDYAVMEKTDKAVVVPLDAKWSDVGSWDALYDIAECGEDGNAVYGDVITEGTTNSYIRAEHRLLAAIGMENCVMVETADAVLVADKSKAQDVKAIVQQLQESKRKEHELHRRVYRPWGYFEGITESDRFQVKHIVVHPEHALSLQMHHHRAEHWVVVRGTARVRCGDEELMISEDQSTYIPLGTVHRLENPGKIPLELIEIQSGSYLGEDDIVRFEDAYNRA